MRVTPGCLAPARWRAVLPLLAALALAALGATAAAARDLAMVIGMGGYRHAAPLRNTVNDAAAIAAQLEANGVEVTLVTDAGRDDLLAALDDFAFRAETADLALVYFSGHGVEIQGENYLIPVDADVRSAVDVTARGVSLSQLMAAVSGARAMRVVILDACRNNPFGASIAPVPAPPPATLASAEAAAGVAVRSVGDAGLAPANPTRGTLVAYAASSGQVSFDGSGRNSPYAEALLEALATPGLEISLMFRQVRDRVMAQTGNRQEPFTYGSLSATPFYLSRPPDGSEAPAPAPPPDQEERLAALAADGDTRAMVLLGRLHEDGADPRFDLGRAVALYEQAAALGEPEAQFRLALLLEEGAPGLPADPDRARSLYESAAAQDFPGAVNNLGLAHYLGTLGFAADPAAALELFRRAADLREPEALFNYAALVDDGLVPGQGPEVAARYLYLALRSGSEPVLSQLSESPASFTRETREALQVRLAETGFYRGLIDGDYGPGTQAAIRQAYGLDE